MAMRVSFGKPNPTAFVYRESSVVPVVPRVPRSDGWKNVHCLEVADSRQLASNRLRLPRQLRLIVKVLDLAPPTPFDVRAWRKDPGRGLPFDLDDVRAGVPRPTLIYFHDNPFTRQRARHEDDKRVVDVPNAATEVTQVGDVDRKSLSGPGSCGAKHEAVMTGTGRSDEGAGGIRAGAARTPRRHTVAGRVSEPFA
jgi:hypothetical protein